MENVSVLSSRVAYPDGDAEYLKIVYGSGPYIFDTSGRRYFDAAGGSGSLILGHGDDRIVEVIRSQASRLTVFPGRTMGCEVVEEYAERLVEFSPPGIDRSIIYSSGSDAVEAAIKLSLQYQGARGTPEKNKVLGRRGSYHGNTLAGLGAGGFIRRRKPYQHVLANTFKAAPAFCEKCMFEKAPSTCSLECARSLEAAITAEGPETVAAFIAEPVVGAALSAATPDKRYFKRIREICDQYDILFIADEVMTGFGRTGRRFAIEHWGAIPDIIVAGKAIGAGYFPLSAILVHAKISGLLKRNHEPFQNGHTFACSPLGSAVALHVLERIQGDNLVANALHRGEQLRSALSTLALDHQIENVRGLGLMIGFDLRETESSENSQGTELSSRFQQLAMARGLIVYPSTGSAESEAGQHVLLLPPLNIEEHHIGFIVDAIKLALQDLEA